VAFELHLHDTKYLVASIVEAGDAALVIEIYPEKGSMKKHPKDERALGAPLYDLDRVAIAYGTITRVVMTTRKTTKDPFGFQSA
jgi:hypothetical protein